MRNTDSCPVEAPDSWHRAAQFWLLHVSYAIHFDTAGLIILHQQRVFSDAFPEIVTVSLTVPIGASSDAQTPMPRAFIVMLSMMHSDCQSVVPNFGVVTGVQ